MVLVHLREHSDWDHTPSAIGRALARSSGATTTHTVCVSSEREDGLTPDETQLAEMLVSLHEYRRAA